MGVLSTASTVFNMASVGVSAYQSVQNVQQQRLQAELAADSLEARAARKDLEAGEALALGGIGQAEAVREGRLDIASQKASHAFGGVKVGEGSALAVAADKAAWTEYERQKVEYEAEVESWGLRYDAALLRRDAANTRATGATASTAAAVATSGQKILGATTSAVRTMGF